MVAKFEAGPTGSFSVLEERGIDLQYKDSKGNWREISLPGTRLGFLPLLDNGEMPRALTIRSAGTAPAIARLWSNCGWNDGVAVDWFASAQLLAERVDPSAPPTPIDLSEYDVLRDATTNPFQRATAVHLSANAAYRAGDHLRSAEDFAYAARLWQNLSDHERSGAALLGQADLLRLLGRFGESRTIAIQARELLNTQATAYFRLRAQEDICLAHHAMNEFDLEALCLQALAPAYLAMKEFDAYFSAVVLTLSLQRQLGARLSIATLDPALIAALSSPEIDPARKGRLHFELAMSLRDQGDISASLREFNAALEEFSQATEERGRWQANTMLQVSGVYADLGMFAQSYSMHRSAMQGFDPSVAPSRIAAALVRLATIDRAAGTPDRALGWAEKAFDLNSKLNLPGPRALAELSLLELREDMSLNTADAEERLSLIKVDLPQQYQSRATLLAARLALRTGHKQAALIQLGTLRRPTRPLNLQHEATLTVALALHEQGRIQEAATELIAQVSGTASVAQSVGNPALAYLMTRSLGGVRRALALLALDPAASEHVVERLWQSLLVSHPLGMYRTDPTTVVSDMRFSADVSRKLVVGEGEWSRSAETLLLERLSGSKNRHAQSRMPGLADVRASMRPDDLLLVIVPTEPTSLLWAVSADSEQRIRIAGRKDLEHSVANLLKHIGAYRSAGPALDQSIAEVSSLLLGGLKDRPVPTRLFVLFEESIGDVPWAVLRWPGRDVPLVEITATSWISRIELADGKPVAAVSARGLDVVVANPEPQGAAAALATLPAADMEASLIALKAPALKPSILNGEKASPEQLRTSLRRRDSIVHLAAHGFSKPGLLGYAGVWLAPKPGTTQPQFLSWLDVADTPLEAGLAVLNACQLAAGPSASNASSLSFSGAISAAGVDQVVAALWPVSDAATVKWVPAFYAALDTRDLGSSAEALRQAQLALRNSRHFRHPFYWASLAHFRHLEVPEVEQVGVR